MFLKENMQKGLVGIGIVIGLVLLGLLCFDFDWIGCDWNLIGLFVIGF